MRPDLWPRVSELLHEALEMPADQRHAWIDGHAADEPEVRREVVRLLAAEAERGRFLDDPLIAQSGAADAVRAALLPDRGRLDAGSLVGPYRIIREIGRGGMGAVYLAARADDVFDKQVAIKVAPGGLVNEVLRERFARERQLLASLDHPGIARVLDGGATSDGLQYLVMEFVDGTPIDVYCDDHRRGLEERLRLIVEVCRAAHYAHDRLIVHRDIKASNVLVGADGRPKLVDFGIAKLLARETTGDGATLVQAWTPECASPEQVRGEPTTIATDVYGLGALLYRLVTGRPVFDLGGRDLLERARIICETPPERPSAAAAPGSAQRWRIPSDVDVIALKALHKEPVRRYRSAEHLAEDIERFLTNRPVLAAPDSWRYRAAKFVRRHPVPTLATAAALLIVLTASAVALWQARRADLERDRAQARLTDVRRLANTLIFDVYDRVGNSPNATSIRRSLVERGLGYLDGFTADAAEDPVLAVELAEAYRRLAAVQGARGGSNLGDREGAMASLAKGRAVLAPMRTRQNAPLEVEICDLRLLRDMTVLLADQPDERRRLTAEAIERANRLRDRYPDRTDVLEAQAHAYFFAALAVPGSDALSFWTEAKRAYGQLLERVPDDPGHSRNLALTEKYIGTIHQIDKRMDLARASFEHALELDRRVLELRPNSRQTTIDLAIDLGNLAQILWLQDLPALAEAAALYRESLALREQAAALDPQDVFARQALGFNLIQLSDLSRQMGELAESSRYARRAIDVYESLAPGEFIARRGLAWILSGRAAAEAGRAEEACRAYRRAQPSFQKAASLPSERGMLSQTTTAFLAEALETCPP